MRYLLLFIFAISCGEDTSQPDDQKEIEKKKVIEALERNEQEQSSSSSSSESSVASSSSSSIASVEPEIINSYTFDYQFNPISEQIDYLLCSGFPASQSCRLVDISIDEWSDGVWSIEMQVKFGSLDIETIAIDLEDSSPYRYEFSDATHPHHMFHPEISSAGTTYFDFDFENKKMVGVFVHNSLNPDQSEYNFHEYEFVEERVSP